MRVSKLRPAEVVGLEFERLERFWRRLGPEHGEIALGIAMEDLALLLQEARVAWEMGDRRALRMRALALQGTADRLGMPQVRTVAGDVIALCSAGDEAALAAIVERLQRLGEGSLCAVWDAQVPVV